MTNPKPTSSAPNPSLRKRRFGILDRLTVSQKLGLASGFLLVPLIILGVTTLQNQTQLLAPVAKSQDVLPLMNSLNQLNINLVDYARTAMNAELGRRSQDDVAARAKKVNNTIDTFKQQLQSKNQPSLFSKLNEIKAQLRDTLDLGSLDSSWEAFTANSEDASPSDMANDFGAVTDGVNQMMNNVGTAGDLRVGGGQTSLFHLQRSAFEVLTRLRSNITRAQLLAEGIMLGASDDDTLLMDSEQDLKALRELMPMIEGDADTLGGDIDTAIKTGLVVPDELAESTQKVKVAAQSVLADLENVTLDETSASLNEDTTKALSDIDQLSKALQAALNKEASQIRSNETKRAFMSLSIILIFSVAAIIFLIRILRSIVQNLRLLTNGSRRLTAGDVGVQVPVTSQDELGVLAQTFNAASAQLRDSFRRSEQERIESIQLQQNIGEFLDVTMDIAEGDLTKRGKVTEDVLGNVVDSINLMTDELAFTLQGVQKTSESVANGSRAMMLTTEQINEGSQMTTHEAQRAAERAIEVNANIQHMAQVAMASAQAARQALQAAQQGEDAVRTTLQGMENIRESSDSVSQRVQALGKRSEEIQEVVDSITQIASQTNLLALHASIEAAGAGPAGTRFSVVAEEVRQLADLSTEATSRIANLIAGVQTEIRQVVQSMRANTQQVEQGYEVAGTAGERLREIGDYVEESARLAEDISQATQEQVQGVEQMGNAVQQIADIAQSSQSSVEQGRNAAEQLQRLADQMNDSLARFRLPS